MSAALLTKFSLKAALNSKFSNFNEPTKNKEPANSLSNLR